MLLPNFYEDLLFKALFAEMQIDPRPSFPQLRISFADPVQDAPMDSSPAVPAITEQKPQLPSPLPKSLLDRLAHIIMPKRQPIQLDQAKRDLITKQTKQVASLVADTIAEQLAKEEESQQDPMIIRETAEIEDLDIFPETINYLDPNYRGVLRELIRKENWLKDEFETLVRSKSLMPSGTIDVLNEWSDEYLDDFIIDVDSEPYKVNLSLVSL